MKNKYKVCLCVAVCALLCAQAVTGCSNTEVDYSVGDTQDNEKNGDTDQVVGLSAFFEEDLNWTDTISSCDSKGNALELSIKAEIGLPDVKQMSVVEVELATIDEAYKEKMLKNIFKEATVYYYDEEHLPKDVLQEKLQAAQENLEYFKQSWEAAGPEMDPDGYWMGYEGTIEEEQKNINRLTDLYEKASDDLIVAKDYSVDCYAGYIGKILYRCEFVNTSDGWRYVYFDPVNRNQIAPDMLKDTQNMYCGMAVMELVKESDQNLCSLTEEEAKSCADRFLVQLGIDRVIETSFGWLSWENLDDAIVSVESDDELRCYDGYCFYYSMELDGVALQDNFSPYYLCYDCYQYRNSDYILEIRINVTDDGVIGFSIHNPCEAVSVCEGVQLLPLDSIKSIVSNEAQTNGAIYQYDSIGIPRMNAFDLVYVTVADEEQPMKYSYVPAWRLCNRKVGDNFYYCTMFINAIDGSIIQYREPLEGDGAQTVSNIVNCWQEGKVEKI